MFETQQRFLFNNKNIRLRFFYLNHTITFFIQNLSCGYTLCLFLFSPQKPVSYDQHALNQSRYIIWR
eukprot:UN34613